ncbi:MAG: DsrE family protein [Thermoproteus sp.]|nr:DsrE family protein [Thermoproteus sp.]
MAATAPVRVVVQISDPAKVEQALASLKNLIAGMPGAEVEAVFHQDAVEAVLKGSPHGAAVRELVEAGARVVACMNSLKARGLSPRDLAEGVGVGEAGVVEIVKRQAEGWAYLRL